MAFQKHYVVFLKEDEDSQGEILKAESSELGEDKEKKTDDTTNKIPVSRF